MDQFDKRILDLLQEDAKLTVKEISEQVGLSSTPVYERIKRMENSGVIEGYRAEINRAKIGLPLLVFCNVNLNQHQSNFIEQFESDIKQFPEVLECYHVAGLYDYLMKVIVPDMDTYQLFVAKKLASLKNIAKVQSSFVMTEVIHRAHYPIDGL